MIRRFFLYILTPFLILGLLPQPVQAANLAVERQVFTFVTEELGLNSAAACGILANMEAESNFNLTCLGDKGTSFGLCQWHNSRYDDLKSFCVQRGYDYRSLEGQLQFMAYELRTRYTGVFNTLRNVPDTSDGAYTAAYQWCYYYERPADLDGACLRRGRNAQFKYWLRYGGKANVTSNGYSGILHEGDGSHQFYWDQEEDSGSSLTIQPPVIETPQESSQQPQSGGQSVTGQQVPSGDRTSTGGGTGHIQYRPYHLPLESAGSSGGNGAWSVWFLMGAPIGQQAPFLPGKGPQLPEDWDGTVSSDEEE